MKKDRDEVTAQKEQMAEQQRKVDKQMAKNTAMMKVLKVTMQSQALANIISRQSQSINPFNMFEASSNEEESGDENADDPMDAEDQMDEPVEEELTNNTDVSP
mmetsp:Transcript_3717/g.5556  ORF Transcript_3717/g.5556 Transcript_3717/m.5556 type:complete len:103 (-) Transcript_3717:8-316(-)